MSKLNIAKRRAEIVLCDFCYEQKYQEEKKYLSCKYSCEEDDGYYCYFCGHPVSCDQCEEAQELREILSDIYYSVYPSEVGDPIPVDMDKILSRPIQEIINDKFKHNASL